MKDVKRQHTVPRTYLKGFTADEKFLYFFDKVSRKAKRVTVRHIAVSDNFYDISPDTISTDGIDFEFDFKFVEKFLANIESEYSLYAKPIKCLRIGEKINAEQKGDMSLFMAVQLLRTFEMRAFIWNSQTAMTQQICSDLVRLNYPEEYQDLMPTVAYDEKFISTLHAKALTDPDRIEKFASILYGHIWQIGVTDNKHILYSSDSPVVRYTALPRVSLRPEPLSQTSEKLVSQMTVQNRYPGIGENGVEIAFPISSNRVILLRDRAYFALQGVEDGLVTSIGREKVDFLNRLQVEQSFRQVFCEKQEFALASQYCQNNPECCDPKRFSALVNTSISASEESLLSTLRPSQPTEKSGG